MDTANFTVTASAVGGIMGNKVSNVNIFSLQSAPEEYVCVPEYDISRFVEYVQLMQATGGSESRDLFVNPLDRTRLDDYKFDELIAKCRAILRFGAKPHIKTGNVPLKFCRSARPGAFSVNLFPPDDYREYYRYIYAIGTALVDAFGRDEVKTWRFGVLTEYENAHWFQAQDGTPEGAFREYCKLYDCTVAALMDSIDPAVTVGAHAMAVAESEDITWDECLFIRRCGPEAMNTWTGKKGVKLDFVNASFYDTRQGEYTTGKPLGKTVGDLRAAAESAGLTHLLYGVDEGRILYGVPGRDRPDLMLRMTGDTWQAGYDARMFKICFDEEIDYFSSWGFFSTGLCCPEGALPTVSYHVANGVARFAGTARLAVRKSGRKLPDGPEIECVAGMDRKNGRLVLMLYNFKNDPAYNVPVRVALNLRDLPFRGRIRVTQQNVDDSCNFFPQWRKDRKTYGIGDECFSWSPDDPAIDSRRTLDDPAARKLYLEKLRPGYAKRARMKTKTRTIANNGGAAALHLKIAPNGVIFLELAEERQ